MRKGYPVSEGGYHLNSAQADFQPEKRRHTGVFRDRENKLAYTEVRLTFTPSKEKT